MVLAARTPWMLRINTWTSLYTLFVALAQQFEPSPNLVTAVTPPWQSYRVESIRLELCKVVLGWTGCKSGHHGHLFHDPKNWLRELTGFAFKRNLQAAKGQMPGADLALRCTSWSMCCMIYKGCGKSRTANCKEQVLTTMNLVKVCTWTIEIELNLNAFRLTNELLFHTRTMFLNLKSIVYHTQGPSNELKDLL